MCENKNQSQIGFPDGAERKLQYRFLDKSLLLRALTHSSFSHDHGTASYDALEFLGDSVLQLVITERLYTDFAGEKRIPTRAGGSSVEGLMTASRAKVVCRESLTAAALALGILDDIRSTGTLDAVQTKVLSDVYEAVVGAIYLDGGLEAARAFILRTLNASAAENVRADDKTRLQEFLQRKDPHAQEHIEYVSVGETEKGAQKIFTEAVCYRTKELARGSGSNKKAAQKVAARKAYFELQKD